MRTRTARVLLAAVTLSPGRVDAGRGRLSPEPLEDRLADFHGASRWFCAVGTRAPVTWASTDEARRFLHRRAPRVFELTSDEQNPYHVIRALVASMLGISIFDRAKSLELPCSEVRRRAEGLWPLWA